MANKLGNSFVILRAFQIGLATSRQMALAASSSPDLLEAQLSSMGAGDRQILSETLDRIEATCEEQEVQADAATIEEKTELCLEEDKLSFGDLAALDRACAKLISGMDKIEKLPDQGGLFSQGETGVFMAQWIEPYKMCVTRIELDSAFH